MSAEVSVYYNIKPLGLGMKINYPGMIWMRRFVYVRSDRVH